MGEKDTTTKLLEDYEEVFADIVNVLLFQKDYIKPEQLRDGPTESVYKAAKGKHRNQFRDILKYYEDMGIELLELGLENQAGVSPVMPVRVLSYDAASYMRQIRKKQRLRPVVTLVLNFSDTPWNEAKTLGEMFVVPEEVKPYFQDYHIHVVDIAYLPDETVFRFQSTFRQVAHFFAHRRAEGKEYQPLDEEIEHLEEFLELLEAFTKDEMYRKVAPELLTRQRKGEKVNMCIVVDTYMNKGIAIGLERGREEGREEGRAEGILQGGLLKLKEQIARKLQKGKSAEEIAEELDEKLTVVRDVIKELQVENAAV